MITKMPAKGMVNRWKETWKRYKNLLLPNSNSAEGLLGYLQSRYSLTEIFLEGAPEAVCENVLKNEPLAEKLPAGQKPLPRAFYLENGRGGPEFLPC